MERELKATISTTIPLTTAWGDPRDRRSILGFVFIVYGGAVMTYSKKMKSVARLTTEAEYVGMEKLQRLPSGASTACRTGRKGGAGSSIAAQRRQGDVKVLFLSGGKSKVKNCARGALYSRGSEQPTVSRRAGR
jgi:hypothetical protein